MVPRRSAVSRALLQDAVDAKGQGPGVKSRQKTVALPGREAAGHLRQNGRRVVRAELLDRDLLAVVRA